VYIFSAPIATLVSIVAPTAVFKSSAGGQIITLPDWKPAPRSTSLDPVPVVRSHDTANPGRHYLYDCSFCTFGCKLFQARDDATRNSEFTQKTSAATNNGS
jgi:hypothetical protein